MVGDLGDFSDRLSLNSAFTNLDFGLLGIRA